MSSLLPHKRWKTKTKQKNNRDCFVLIFQLIFSTYSIIIIFISCLTFTGRHLCLSFYLINLYVCMVIPPCIEYILNVAVCFCLYWMMSLCCFDLFIVVVVVTEIVFNDVYRSCIESRRSLVKEFESTVSVTNWIPSCCCSIRKLINQIPRAPAKIGFFFPAPHNKQYIFETTTAQNGNSNWSILPVTSPAS